MFDLVPAQIHNRCCLTIHLGESGTDPFLCSDHHEIYVQLSVSDSGVGMDAATMERMFEPFFTAKDKSKGTGLGLATAFDIAKQHLGHIDVHSEAGKGSIFRVYLPATEDFAETRMAIEEAPVRGGTETILLAEDHEGSRQMSHEVLPGLGYSIVPARDGREAVEKFEANPLFTSGYSEESQILSSLVSSGIAQLLQKLYPPKDLARKIRDILANCGAKQGSALNYARHA